MACPVLLAVGVTLVEVTGGGVVVTGGGVVMEAELGAEVGTDSEDEVWLLDTEVGAGEALEEAGALEEGETLEEGEALDEGKALEEGDTLDDGKALEEGEALEEGKALEEGETLEEDETLEEGVGVAEAEILEEVFEEGVAVGEGVDEEEHGTQMHQMSRMRPRSAISFRAGVTGMAAALARADRRTRGARKCIVAGCQS